MMSPTEPETERAATALALPLPPVLDQDEDNDNDDDTSRTNNTRSLHHRNNSNATNTTKRSHSRSMHSSSHGGDSRSNSNGSSPSYSHFEINCSPLPLQGAEKSYYEETRMRRKQQKQKENEISESTSTSVTLTSHESPLMTPQVNEMDESETEDGLLLPNTPQQANGNHENSNSNLNTPTNTNTHHVIPNDENYECENDPDKSSDDNDDDADSCCTLVDSGMSFHQDCYLQNKPAMPTPMLTTPPLDEDEITEDNTISTSKMGSTNMDTNSSSNFTPTETGSSRLGGGSDSYLGNNTLTSFSSSRSYGSSVSRGEEHISSRMKKYGLFNLHEMKRKQQQRRANRNNNNNNTTAPSAAAAAKSIQNNGPLSVNSGLTEGMTESSGPGAHTPDAIPKSPFKPSSKNNDDDDGAGVPTKIRTAPLHVQMAVEEIHRWLFTEGGHFEDVQTLMTQYSLYVREHFGIPLDRLYYGGVGLHPKLTAYLWKWEAHGEFTHAEMPPHIFARRNELFSPDEPFCVLEQGRADHVRIKDTDSYIPPDTAKWFRGGHYKDYFALPDIHRGVSKGGLAWSTKSQDGFCDDDIQFFRMTHAALTTIMRLHTNDLVLNTLTDRMEAEIEDRTNELNIANKKLEEANAEISRHASKQLEHFACMSHEIRTPLNCIVGLSSLLLESNDDALNDDLLDTIRMVYNSADLVQGVVNDVLDYAKIESGHFELDVKPSDLQTTLNGVVHSISNKLVDKNVTVRTSYSGLLGKTMTTDSRRLQQILYNILGNAAKFSREGTTIDFKVSVILNSDDNNSSHETKSEESESINSNSVPSKTTADAPTQPSPPQKVHTIRFSIKDYGKGIEEKNFEKIFQPFSQASKETQTIYGGTGLGLSITKNLVARLGGKISIRSEIEKFTEFIVDLPYEDEQLANLDSCRENFSETSIVILDPTEKTQSSGGATIDDAETENDDFLPFPTSVVEQYGLSVLRCSSWGELESKLGLRANIRENYFFLAHEDIEERQGILNVEKLVKKERCSWFTFGSESMSGALPQRREHFKTLTGIFPAALLKSISEIASAQRELGSSSSSSSGSSVSSIESNKSSGMQDEPEEALSSSLDSQKSNTTKSKKKFATKYPPRNLKVLVVDDNVINQKVLDRILKRLGVTDISIVDNGKKAVDITATTQFDCIFMDMEMPVMGGLEACKLIVDRDKEAARVAFVTAHDIEDIREKADAAGAYGYISKPLKMKDIHEFLNVLETLETVSSRAAPVVKSKTTNKTDKQGSSGIASPKKRSTPPKKQRSTKIYPPRNIKVLVAEDNLINQKVLDRILKRLGVKDITIVDNGKKAVDASEQTKFDCILMDMQMPIMDGLEACKIIVKRDQDKEDSPKIVFVTAHALVEFREKALAAGAFDFITKPFKMEDIDNVLKILENPVAPSSSTANAEMGSSSSEESSNAKPTKMPKLAHALSD